MLVVEVTGAWALDANRGAGHADRPSSVSGDRRRNVLAAVGGQPGKIEQRQEVIRSGDGEPVVGSASSEVTSVG